MRRRPWRLPALLLVVAIVATGCQMPAAWLALLVAPDSCLDRIVGGARPNAQRAARLRAGDHRRSGPGSLTARQVGDHPARHLSRFARLDA